MPGERPSDRRAVWFTRALVAVAAAPIVVATVSALAEGWIPIGDNGLILLRVQDVGTAHNPLTGTWTSASLVLGETVRNPGPLWFDFLAPFVRLLGPSVGMATGVMVANVGAVVLAAWAARRAGGRHAMAVVTMLSAGLAWSIGPDLLYDPLQPNAMVLPFWALLVALWALAQGDAGVGPAIVILASLVLQTHVAFLYLAGVLGAAALAMCVLEVRRRDDHRSSWLAPLRWSVGIGLVCWAQPLVEQVTGQGNLGRLLGNAGGGATLFGPRLSARIVAAVVALPPWWGRPSFDDAIRRPFGTIEPADDPVISAWRDPSFTASALALAAFGVLLAVAVLWARRRGDRPGKLIGILALAACATAVASVAISPINIIGLSAHQLRFLWPVATLATAGVLVPVARWSPRPSAVFAVTGALTLGLAAATMAVDDPLAPAAEPASLRSYQPSVEVLVDGIDDYEPTGQVRFDASTLRFAEPYSGPVLAALGRNGIDFTVDTDMLVAQVGERRRSDGTEERRVIVIEGPAALDPPEGAVPIAVVPDLDEDEAAELEAVEAEVVAIVARRGLRLSAAGRRAAAADWIDAPDEVVAAGSDPEDVDVDEVALLLTESYVDLPAALVEPAERYLELLADARRRPVGLFELPAN